MSKLEKILEKLKIPKLVLEAGLLLPLGLFSCNTSVSYYEQGVELAQKGKYGDAKPYFDQAIERDARNPVFYYNRALAEIMDELHGTKEEDYDKIVCSRALQDLDKAIEMRPDYDQALHLRGQIYLLFNRNYQPAIWDYDKLISKGFDRIDDTLLRCYTSIINNRGVANLLLGEIDTAIKDFKAAYMDGDRYGCAYARENLDFVQEMQSKNLKIDPKKLVLRLGSSVGGFGAVYVRLTGKNSETKSGMKLKDFKRFIEEQGWGKLK